ncbi:hypothetical protein M513_07117 [Trichuris suis]|uniref:Vacuolar-sorting protein SNF8 n=1 Tax=Trichuris suis TaxID=68888 RepID=A0A085M439_9BILA|nr:hypothetical protein M513_07117 [Trichuris suis]
MRRSVGVGAIQRKKEVEVKFKEKGTNIASENLRELSVQMEVFRKRLETFAAKFHKDIRKDPVFRKQFLDMCASIGVDPLACNATSKGFWSTKLNFGNFYYELAVQMIEVFMATSQTTGGIITIDELRAKVMKSRGSASKDEITRDDILKAARSMKALGPGFTVTKFGDDYLVHSIPKEINSDHSSVLALAKENGYLTVEDIVEHLSWTTYRAQSVLEHFIAEGMAWLDEQNGERSPAYWFPAFFTGVPDSS